MLLNSAGHALLLSKLKLKKHAICTRTNVSWAHFTMVNTVSKTMFPSNANQAKIWEKKQNTSCCPLLLLDCCFCKSCSVISIAVESFGKGISRQALEQGYSTGGPQAKSGPPIIFIRPEGEVCAGRIYALNCCPQGGNTGLGHPKKKRKRRNNNNNNNNLRRPQHQ